MSELTRSDLNGIERRLSQLANITEHVSGQVDTVQSKQVDMDSRLNSLAQLFDEFVRADALAKELSLAETRVLRVRGELENEFGQYKDVRLRATGILEAFDSGVISDDTIRDTSEEVMVATPRYWLAPTLVALAAWSRDDQPLAQAALAESVRRDPRKTSLFFSLVLRRYGRAGAAARWLGAYFDRQDPTALTREFVILLDAVATGAYGVEGRTEATETINIWLESLENEQGFLDQQVDRWRDALLALKPNRPANYPTLQDVSGNWQAMKNALDLARIHEQVRDHFAAIFEGELQTPVQLERMMDDLLDRLVREFDEEELPLRKQEAELQAIIDHGGDKVAAAASAEQAQAALEERVDFPSLLTNAAMRPEEAGASKATERLAVAISRDWILQAYDGVVAYARDAVPGQIDVTIDGWSCTIGDDTDGDALIGQLGAHIDAETDRAVDAVKFNGPPLIAAVVGAALLLLGLVQLQPVLIVLALAAVAYGWWGWHGLDGRRDDVRARGEQRRAAAVQRLQSTFAELVDYHGEWSREDDIAEEARGVVEAISPVDHMAASAHGAREVI